MKKDTCIPVTIDLNKALLANTLTLVSQCCDKKAEIEFNGKKYVIREVTSKTRS